MPQKPISFGPLQESAYDELSGAMPSAMNVVIDARGVVRRRPCVATHADLSSSQVDADGIVGMHATVAGRVYAVAGAAGARSVYRVGAGLLDLSGGDFDLMVPGSGRPVFAETESILVIAGGSEPQKVVLATDVSSRLGGSPPTCTHAVANASRILVNRADDYKGQVYFSDTAAGSAYTGFETWYGINSGFFSAEGRPDEVKALGENSNEVITWGNTTTQVFVPDPNAVYSPLPVLEYGCAAPYSVVRFDQKFAWLDHRSRFVMSDGRQALDISGDISNTLKGITTVSDCFGYRVSLGGYDCLAWTFPTDGRTFVYQPGVGWGQWSGWDTVSESWSRFAVNAHAYNPVSGLNVVGTTDGYLGALSLSAHQDLGTPVNAKVRTGFQAHETDARKHCKSVAVMLRRGEATEDGVVGILAYRDQPNGQWTRLLVSLGSAGDTNPVVHFRSLGVYRQRQWEFTFTGNEALSLVGVVEDFDVLEV